MITRSFSFMGANLVAEQLGWCMPEGWGQGDRAANDHYRSIDTFPARFGAFIDHATGLGLESVDVWNAQLNWAWVTPAHTTAARRILDERGVSVASYGGWFGSTIEQFRSAVDVAEALGTELLGGGSAVVRTDRTELLALLRDSGKVLAYENHPSEHTPADVLSIIGEDRDVLATTVDTGWWGSQGYDAALAIRELGSAIRHVHLKDVRAAGSHNTCTLGDGVVPIRDCLVALNEVGYAGSVSIEHEPEDRNPLPEIEESLRRARTWMAEL